MTIKLAASLIFFLPMASVASAQPPGAALSPFEPNMVIRVQSDPAEIAFWNSVKDSRNPAEVQSYIDRYPNGVFVDLAKLRLDVLGSAPGPSAPPPVIPTAPPPVFTPTTPPPPPPIVPVSPFPPTPPPPPPPPPVTPSAIDVDMNSPVIVREIQERLFNLNYAVPLINGAMGDRTRDAIRRWQTNVNRPVTGFMTPDQLAFLRTAVPPSLWGAVAYTARGHAGTAWQFKSRREAEDGAIEECRKRAGRRAQCNVLSTFDNGCGALAVHQTRRGSTTHFEAFAVTRTTLGQARTDALQNCNESPKARGNCKIQIDFCANGAHKS